MIQDEAVIGGGIMCKRHGGATFYDLQFFKKKNPEPAVINGNASGVPKVVLFRFTSVDACIRATSKPKPTS